MYICFLNHNVIATYGVGSGNTPAFFNKERRTPVGGSFFIPKSLLL